MVTLALIVLICGAFVVAVLAADARFGHPRRKDDEDRTPEDDDA